MKIELNNQDLIAPCGLYCGECEAFQDGRCEGCISRKGLCLKYTEICKIYSCCVDGRGHRFCSECQDFPCEKFTKFFNTLTWYNEVVGNLKKIKNIGTERFLEEQAKRVKELIKCAEEKRIKHCSQCKEWPCEKLKRPPLVPE
jgi:hypothetical protein